MGARSHVTYLTVCCSQPPKLLNGKSNNNRYNGNRDGKTRGNELYKMIAGQTSGSLLSRVCSFQIGKRSGKTLGKKLLGNCHKRLRFLLLFLESLIKKSVDPLFVVIGHVARPSLPLWITLSTFTRVDITWTLRDSLVLLSWRRYFDHQCSDIALRNFKLGHGFASKKLCRVFCLAKTLWVSLETPYAESLWERRAQIRQIQVHLKS